VNNAPMKIEHCLNASVHDILLLRYTRFKTAG
jgi:hypothetical protein